MKTALVDPQRRFIDVENRFHFLAVVWRQLTQADDLAHDLRIITLRFRFVIGVADVVGDALLLFFQTLDALDEKAQLFVGHGGFAHFILR
ncbi:protein of unknown function [uncultured Sphingopyxis sp.]|uniref:Uncharacterized protein n=1 Tax=uncultured Sphingopyxis sp. TaxID=310581 RepID=A0A1Y5PUZ6_9SPHN|nr:protein of unknown function [uncultured Sphingopyxis sp.]